MAPLINNNNSNPTPTPAAAAAVSSSRTTTSSSKGGGRRGGGKQRKSSYIRGYGIEKLKRMHIVKLREEDGEDRILQAGTPDFKRCDNTLITSKYTIFNFLLITVRNQFRRFANMYFLVVGIIMWIGWRYPHLYSSAFSPVSLLGPLIMFISISLLMEGMADKKRHVSDYKTNTFRCIVLENENADSTPVSASVMNSMNNSMVNVNAKNRRGSVAADISCMNEFPWDDVEVPVSTSVYSSTYSPTTTNTNATTTAIFRPIPRKDIRQGHLVVLRNREIIPADIVLLASSGDRGCAYIETSSIDGETNLKLRLSAKSKADPNFNKPHETMEEAVRRIAAFTIIGCPILSGDLDNKGIIIDDDDINNIAADAADAEAVDDRIAKLKTEPPDAHINTFSGLLKLPQLLSTINEEEDEDKDNNQDHSNRSTSTSSNNNISNNNNNNNEILEQQQQHRELPLGAEHLLLRGAVLRNTEWAIGIACYTGTDTKLSQNSIEAPSKFSQLDLITNKCVIVMIFVELACIIYLSTASVIINKRRVDEHWYLGRKVDANPDDAWPYLPDLASPKWRSNGDNWLQSALTNVTLLSYFVPLSMYFTLEVVNFFSMWLIYVDIDMYDATTDTRAEPRSTNYTDLGQVQYVFSDKTGTLTQNVMRFKRCSINGMIFGAPVEKNRPATMDGNGDDDDDDNDNHDDRDNGNQSSFHPIRQVFVGDVYVGEDGKRLETTNGMTFNTELFLRVMSLCHTVVVEKDLDLAKEKDGNEGEMDGKETATKSMAADGAPLGYAYQAESPDEGALVSEASKTFGFQVVSRDSTGIRLKCDHPTLFGDEELVRGLKSGKVDPRTVATNSASGSISINRSVVDKNDLSGDHIETWSVLAINKFDSTRKRMSILVRSPPEFGNSAILLCKGADSAMLDPEVCTSSQTFFSGKDDNGGTDSSVIGFQQSQQEDSEWELAKMLGIESHLGEFASEGLRTLVLGVRFLTDDQCDEWLTKYTAAATAMKDREEKLTEAAFEIEKELHIVGATAIEDKLQVGVPDTIATLEKAGIKLWVLTGDKRETAIEIGYSTQVLTPRMHLTEISDRGAEFVRAQCAMEFMRLVKAGKLPLYQRAVVDQEEQKVSMKIILSFVGTAVSAFFRSLKRLLLQFKICVRGMLGCNRKVQQQTLESLNETTETEKDKTSDLVRRRNVRNRAEAIVKQYSEKYPSINKDGPELSTDVLPPVFNRAESAKEMLDLHRSEGKLTAVDERASKLSQLNAQEIAEKQDKPTIDDDMLSLLSFMPSNGDKNKSDFDKKKRTMLERMFAVDRDVRKGRLVKHLKKEKRIEALASSSIPHDIVPSSDGPRALVIEGSALKHLQGDDELEELVFNIASQCESVIACRVTPRQKAQLVKLVRHHVVPEPVTLAIGDGANDVGMIHAAHIGIGISGKEGQQAVNASDFSIGQFRFLEYLILYHGRWDFMRTSMVVLYTFYKNAVIAGLLVLYNNETLFSGTSLFDQWLMAGFSFVCFFPILTVGMFDRSLDKSYIKRNPEVYKATQQKELITKRTLFRWVFMALAHVFILYYGQLSQICQGGGNTSAFAGLMWNNGTVGDGEVRDWQSAGTTIFTSMVLLMAYKILYEARSIINGKWPASIACFKTTKEGFISRIPYTLYGVLFGSLGMYTLCLSIYTGIGQTLGVTAGSWFIMVSVPQHVFGTSSLNYIMILFIPIGCMAFDLSGKIFSNMFYPSQTQIHIELEAKEFGKIRKAKRQGDAAAV